MTLHAPYQRGARAFTLVELLLALVISLIVLTAISGTFFGAVHLRERTSEALNSSLPVNQALAILRRDLQATVGPSNVLAGAFKCGAPSMGVNMGLGTSAGIGIDFFAATGVINDDEPWGDIQEVYYELTDPADGNRAAGKDLVRNVNRNLLATSSVTPEVQWLMGNVESLEFSCFDGLQWRDTWDTSNGDTNLPAAVRIRIQLAVTNGANAVSQQPMEMIVPLVVQSRINTNTNVVSTAGGSGG